MLVQYGETLESTQLLAMTSSKAVWVEYCEILATSKTYLNGWVDGWMDNRY